jgi:hypothetical protein
LCDGAPRLFVGRLIAISASPLMQHVKAYRGAMTPSAPTRRTRSESYVTELQPAVQSATLQIAIIAKANLGRAEGLLGVEQSVVCIWRSFAWGIEFDNRGSNEAGTTTNPSTGSALFFAAGINDDADGLFATLTPTTPQLNAEDHE